MQAIICFTSCCIFCLPSLALGADEELLSQWEYLLAGWEAARDELQSGEFTFFGRDTRFADVAYNDPPVFSREKNAFELSGHAAFDTTAESFFHALQWKRVWSDRMHIDRAKSEAWILTDGRLYEWSEGHPDGFLTVRLASQKPNHSWRKLDPRGLGVLGVEEVVSDRGCDLFELSKEFLRQRLKPVEIETNGNLHTVTCELSIEAASHQYYSQLVFNEAKGFAIERARHDMDPTGKYGFSDLDIRVEWVEYSGVWVPAKVAEQGLPVRPKRRVN